jgi:hypothetical protein
MTVAVKVLGGGVRMRAVAGPHAGGTPALPATP